MPQQQQLRSDEKPEFSFRGPFGGIQSDMPLDTVEANGFSESLNFLLRKALAEVRPGYVALPSVGAATVGCADFEDLDGDLHQVLITPAKLREWNSVTQTWADITPASVALTGTASDLFAWTVVNHKLLFSQGIDKVQLWDGLTATFDAASADAVPARFLMELVTHLVVGYTTEGGQDYTQRTRWTRSGDPTDWTALSAGVHDELGDFGPMTGMAKMYQQGYEWFRRGVVRVVPTGSALVPFQFIPVGGKHVGNICPRSLAVYRDSFAFFVGQGNVYAFDGVNFNPIGASAIAPTSVSAGSALQAGARKRIFQELRSADLNQVTGFVTTSFAGIDYAAYWLVIPQGSVWIYNIEEGNWTRLAFDLPHKFVGEFFSTGGLRWVDLIGPWTDLAARWSDLANANPFPGLALAFSDAGNTVGYVDGSVSSESAFQLSSAQLVIGDHRHTKTVLRARVVFENRGACAFDVTVQNEQGQSDSQNVQFDGASTAPLIEKVLSFKINGLFIRWDVVPVQAFPNAQPLALAELTLYYDTGGEYVNQRVGPPQSSA